MTTKIYSRLDPTKLLHMIVREIPEGRTNLCPDEQFLQCAALRLPKGTTFRPHRHNWNVCREDRIAQESWFVHRGKVSVTFYDIDDTIINKFEVWEGETTFTFEAAHTYEILADDTVVMEYKTGRYLGVEHDKTFL